MNPEEYLSILRILFYSPTKSSVKRTLLRRPRFGSCTLGLRMLCSPKLRRHSQVAKAAVCKTVIHRFESGCRLQSKIKGL
jgi:hypothetical protein